METLRYVILINSLLVVVSVAFYALLRRETFFEANRLALWLGMAASLALPLLELPDWRPQPVRAVMQRTVRVIVPRVLPSPPASQSDVTITFPDGRTFPAFSPRSVVLGWSWQQKLLSLYAAVLIALLIRFGIRLRSLLQMIWQSVHEPYDDFTLVKNGAVTSPFSFFGWVVLNPDYHEPDELEQILRHERVHVRAWHSVDMVGAELVSILFWFNPAAYLFRQLVHQTLEFSADRTVLAEGIDPQSYQYHLVKVSLSARQSTISNHFSKSQLKSRIAMLNKPKSSRSIWLRYSVLCIATLTVAATFARSRIKIPSERPAAPVAQTIPAMAIVDDRPNNSSIRLAERATTIEASKPVTKATSDYETQERQPTVATELMTDSSKSNSVRVSPSRYMVYENNLLYWIVTPKTTFDDLAVMKQEFAKHGHQMQLNELKYDPLYAYIDRIVVTVVRPTGGMTRVDELKDDDKPIPSVAGYVGIGSKASGSGTGGLRYYGKEFPEALHRMAKEDEAAIAQFAKEHRLDYLLQAGTNKFNELGSGATTYSKEYFKNKSTRSSGITIQPEGSLLVNEELGSIKIFINNEPVTREAVSMWTAKQLYAVVKKSQSNPATKESFTSALLIYANEDN